MIVFSKYHTQASIFRSIPDSSELSSIHHWNWTFWQQFDPTRTLPNGPRWLDLAGFRQKDGFAWERFREWKQRCRGIGERPRQAWHGNFKQFWETEESDWDTVTGSWTGEWVKYTGDLNLTDVRNAKHRARDLLGDGGQVTVQFHDMVAVETEVFITTDMESELGYYGEISPNRGVRLVREVSASIAIRGDNTSSDDDVTVNVYGVHWPRIGALLMTTTSVNFAGIFGLPQLGLDWEYFVTSRKLLNETIGKTPAGINATLSEWADPKKTYPGAKSRTSTCQYVVYIQMHPFEKRNMRINISEIHGDYRECCFYDKVTQLGETESPMSVAVFSPDCGVYYGDEGAEVVLLVD
ncbi:uncharacterized protein LY89DRAFT_759801 [Mollisia scopiformis]|uniref:Uncharacterized protein n=1 Tax=Mollisia scopiformis TaxID=149040 RepID=A0A194WTD6_MOLSC|nr:uncharacterized protein LY89DRAFT_759801 [Mollisia scopiformis]KUJ10872.1 hypothetical protein LY89DRAFT_759801 [Mollisia scopiformis]